MKIRKLTPDNHSKTSALLTKSFPKSTYEVQLFENLHKNGKTVHEWVCIQTNKIIAYVAFSNAYNGSEICGLHLGPVAVKHGFRKQGIATELLNFALRQAEIKDKPIFVLGNPLFFKRFGFEHCAQPVCPFKKNKYTHFLSLHNNIETQFTIGYESEFKKKGLAVIMK